MACRWNHAGQRHLEGRQWCLNLSQLCPLFVVPWRAARGVQWASQPRHSCTVIKMMAMEFQGIIINGQMLLCFYFLIFFRFFLVGFTHGLWWGTIRLLIVVVLNGKNRNVLKCEIYIYFFTFLLKYMWLKYSPHVVYSTWDNYVMSE